jgi:hypothetical protein
LNIAIFLLGPCALGLLDERREVKALKREIYVAAQLAP